ERRDSEPEEAVDVRAVLPLDRSLHPLAESGWAEEDKEPSRDFLATEKRRRRPWRERVGDAGAPSIGRARRSPGPFQGRRVLTDYCTLMKRPVRSELHGSRRESAIGHT